MAISYNICKHSLMCMDIYLKLAKDFFEDPDTAVRYGEKLAAYYDYIVEGM